jgi:hypothetical protein
MKIGQGTYPETTKPRPKNQEIFFLEYGHDGYQKNPLSIQIPEKSTFLCDKMHPKQYILKQKWLSLFQGPYFKFLPFLPVTCNCKCILSLR